MLLIKLPAIANGLELKRGPDNYRIHSEIIQLGLMLSTEVGRGVQIEQVSQGKKSKVP